MKSGSKLRAVEAMSTVLENLGFNMRDENIVGTPERFVKYLQEFTKRYDPKNVLKVDFSQEYIDHGYRGMVAQHNIPFRTICPHHLLPVTGRAHIGYIPNGRVVGLSKLVRIVDAVGHEKPRMQETATDLVADILMEHLGAKGVIVVIAADHGCMTGRGVQVHDVPTSTSTVRGLFRDVPAAREEFFELTRISRTKPT